MVLRGAARWISCAVSVVTATLASRFIRGVWVPVTTMVCSCSGSRVSVKSAVARPPSTTLTVSVWLRKPIMRTRTTCDPAGTSSIRYSPVPPV